MSESNARGDAGAKERRRTDGSSPRQAAETQQPCRGDGAEPGSLRLAREAGTLAGMASRLLAEELAGPGDTKRAKDLSGIFKDMAALSRDLGGGEQSVTVRFEGETAEAGA